MLIIRTKLIVQFFSVPFLIFILISSICSKENSNSNNNNFTLSNSLFIQQPLGIENHVLQDVNNNDLSFLLEKQYMGEYHSLEINKKLFGYLNSKSGTVQAILFKNQMGSTNQDIDGFQMILFDPYYHDGRAVRVQIKLENVSSIDEWNKTNTSIDVSKIWKERTQSQQNKTNVNYSIKLENTGNKNPKEVIMNLNFQGDGVTFNARMTFYQPLFSALGYCLYVSAVALFQSLSVYFLLRKIDRTDPNIASKISLTTTAICNIEDFYYTMTHIQYIMTSGPTTYLLYIIPSIFYILLFVALDMRLLLLAWRSRYMRGVDGPQGLRKKLAAFYIKFYLALFVYLALTFFFSYDVWMIVIQNLIMFPQIIHNARIGNNPGFEPLYVFGYIGLRFLIPFYQRACPYNHFMLTPMVGLVVIIFLLYVLQIVILFLQSKCGPRFFIPKIMQPDYYNYNYTIKIDDTNRDLQCSICLQNFFNNNQTNSSINSSRIEQSILIKERNVMRTPCNHLFHRECLTNWSDVKMECPTCRAPLPPL